MKPRTGGRGTLASGTATAKRAALARTTASARRRSPRPAGKVDRNDWRSGVGSRSTTLSLENHTRFPIPRRHTLFASPPGAPPPLDTVRARGPSCAMTTLRALRARPVLVPIRRPPVSASGAIPKAALVLFDLETDDGVTGRSYVFGFAPWTLPSIVGCAQGLFEMIKGAALAPLDLEAKLRGQLTLLDPNGLVGLALAGLVMAALDALVQVRGVALCTLPGGA